MLPSYGAFSSTTARTFQLSPQIVIAQWTELEHNRLWVSSRNDKALTDLMPSIKTHHSSCKAHSRPWHNRGNPKWSFYNRCSIKYRHTSAIFVDLASTILRTFCSFLFSIWFLFFIGKKKEVITCFVFCFFLTLCRMTCLLPLLELLEIFFQELMLFDSNVFFYNHVIWIINIREKSRE